jgi:FtsH-binding integral membrane protein
MKGVKLLQFATVITFVVFVVAGFAVLIFAPERMSALSALLTAIFPLFIAEVVPAFLGTPLKEYIKTKKEV